MKRFFVFLMILVMLSTGTAWATGENGTMEAGRIVPIKSGELVDLDEDGVQEIVEYEILRDEDGYDTGYRLRVGESEVTESGYAMNESIYLLKLSEYGEKLLLVSDYGASDDYETNFFVYSEGQLQSAGKIYSLPESMRIENGIITAPVRGNLMYTWFHDADFALAYNWSEGGHTKALIHPIPRYLYPMSLIVTSKVELPLMTSMVNHEICATIDAGEEVILCATDDVEWVYIQSVEGDAAGWIRAGGESGIECEVGGEIMYSYEVFDGLLFAD